MDVSCEEGRLIRFADEFDGSPWMVGDTTDDGWVDCRFGSPLEGTSDEGGGLRD